MSEPFLAEIRIVPFNFPPRGWALCDGQILPINQHEALYSLLGTTYGGDGRTSFALPDLRGRIPFHADGGVGGFLPGQKGGAETHTLNTNEIPQHTHDLYGHAGPDWGDADTPDGKLFAESPVGDLQYTRAAPNAMMNSECITSTGGSQAHDNLPPVLVLHFVIALTGLFPSRS